MSIAKGTILVTGANGGLGVAIANQIASEPELAGFHGVYVVRDAAAPALRPILATTSHSHEIVSMELTNLDSVRQAAGTINTRIASGGIPPIQALILNAGFQDFGKQVWTEDGFDVTFSANYLGQFLLTLLLLKSMNKDSGRIVLVGSEVHDPYDKRNEEGQVYTDDRYKTIVHDQAGFEAIARGTWSSAQEDPSWRSGSRRYGAAKLFSIMMNDDGYDAPRVVVIRVLVFKIIYPVVAYLWPDGQVRSTQKSASQVLRAAFDPSLGEFPKGLYFFDTKLLETSAESKDQQKRKMIWKESIRYAHVKEGETILNDWQ
ncbi:Uu.00g067900.m01.CDS01 [Anthostomella pinea]|uniref:Uu.00g067900.m01.CDS01 n=1 Tax=Anthostomella pinea TaxID=933095 RepID=A0AAI8YNG6_9PEZI|nr:Uu.00g067900.m01.CDS01 [Anthostomella pinea]